VAAVGQAEGHLVGDSAAEGVQIAAGRQVDSRGVVGIVVAQFDPTLASEPESQDPRCLDDRRQLVQQRTSRKVELTREGTAPVVGRVVAAGIAGVAHVQAVPVVAAAPATEGGRVRTG
jgi:hypothetical protein